MEPSVEVMGPAAGAGPAGRAVPGGFRKMNTFGRKKKFVADQRAASAKWDELFGEPNGAYLSYRVGEIPRKEQRKIADPRRPRLDPQPVFEPKAAAWGAGRRL